MTKNLMSPLTALELSTLEELRKHHQDDDIWRRARNIISLNARCSAQVIAQVLGVSATSVYNWAKWWRHAALAGLLDEHKGGRPVKLTPELVDCAAEVAVSEPLTLEGIRQRVRERHPEAPDFSVDRLSARLKQHGVSFKRCRLSLKKRPEQEFAEKQLALESLKAVAKDGHIHLYFFDGSGISNTPNVQRAWSPLCQPHCADASVSRKRVNILGALHYAANKLVRALQEISMKRPQVVEFTDRLVRQHEDGKPIIIVLDNASIHHHIDEKQIVRWVLDHQLILYHLPPYSPEFNSIEILWKQAKYYWRKFTTWEKLDLFREVNEIFRRYGDKFEISFA